LHSQAKFSTIAAKIAAKWREFKCKEMENLMRDHWQQLTISGDEEE